MIVVDTSALIAIVLDEPSATWLERVLQAESGEILISAGTVAESLIVAAGRRALPDMELLLDGLDHKVVPVDEAMAKRVGKGYHPAGLNFGDCFAYALAVEKNCPLLFIGNDFSRTDVKSVLANQSGA